MIYWDGIYKRHQGARCPLLTGLLPLLSLVFCSVDKVKVLSLMLHAADISHPAKAWPLHHRWTHSLMEEFFRQVVDRLPL